VRSCFKVSVWNFLFHWAKISVIASETKAELEDSVSITLQHSFHKIK